MDSRQYERLYGMRSRLFAGAIALTLLGGVLAFRPSRPRPSQSAEEAAGGATSQEDVAVASIDHPAGPFEAPPSAPTQAEAHPGTAAPEPEISEPPKALIAPAPGSNNVDQSYVVRPGDYVWMIAESFCGSGFRWREVYEANRDQIVDPDLIYPDQKFVLTCQQ